MSAKQEQVSGIGSWRDSLILKGFRQRGYLAESKGQHGAISFVFTPMVPEEVEPMIAKSDKADPKLYAQEMATILHSKLESWSLGEGKPTLDQIRQLRYRPFNRVYQIIAGLAASDPDPAGESDEEIKSKFEPLEPLKN